MVQNVKMICESIIYLDCRKSNVTFVLWCALHGQGQIWCVCFFFFDVSIQYFCLFNYCVKLRAKWRPFSTHSICSPRLPRQVSNVYSFVKSASYHSSFILDFPSIIRHIWYYSHIDTCGLFRELYWISPSKCWVAYIV